MRKPNIFGKKGQNTAEYAIIIALVIAAAIAMQTYVKRGVQGRVHDASDRFYDNITTGAKDDWDKISSTPVDTLTSKQYEPEKFSAQTTQQTLTDYERTEMETGGKVTRASRQKTTPAAGDYEKYEYKDLKD